MLKIRGIINDFNISRMYNTMHFTSLNKNCIYNNIFYNVYLTPILKGILQKNVYYLSFDFVKLVDLANERTYRNKYTT